MLCSRTPSTGIWDGGMDCVANYYSTINVERTKAVAGVKGERSV